MSSTTCEKGVVSARQLRESRGLSPHEVAERMRVSLGEERRHFTSVTKMEKEGSYKVDTIRAYAAAVGWDFESALAFFEPLAKRTSVEKKSRLPPKV